METGRYLPSKPGKKKTGLDLSSGKHRLRRVCLNGPPGPELAASIAPRIGDEGGRETKGATCEEAGRGSGGD